LIFGECFFTAIKDVLGDAANNDVMNGWMEGSSGRNPDQVRNGFEKRK
jgi:hypothetical protein